MAYELSIQNAGPVRIQVIKELREALGCSLADAKACTENTLMMLVRDEVSGPLARKLHELEVTFELRGCLGDLTAAQSRQLFQAARVWKASCLRPEDDGNLAVLWDLVEELERTTEPKPLRTGAPSVYDHILEDKLDDEA